MPTDTTTNTPAAQDSHHLIAEARARSGDDPIFALNAEARKRAAAGEHVVNATLGALLEDDGSLAVMPVVFEALDAVPKAAAAAYAPIAGAPAFLAAVVEDTFGTGPLAAACAERGRYTFQLTIAALRLVGGTASPINPIALF